MVITLIIHRQTVISVIHAINRPNTLTEKLSIAVAQVDKFRLMTVAVCLYHWNFCQLL